MNSTTKKRVQSSAVSKKKGKLVIEFDEDSRREFLTGFSKRKAERRKLALKNLEHKAHQETLATRRELRDRLENEKRELRNNAALIEEAEEVAGEEEGDSADRAVMESLNKNKNEKIEQFVDDFSSHVFGSAHVTVTTTTSSAAAPPPPSSQFEKQSDFSKGIVFPKHAKLAQSETAKIAARLRDKISGKRTRKNTKNNSGRKPEKTKKKVHHRK